MSTSESFVIDGSAFNSKSDILYTKSKLNSSGGKNVGIINIKTKKSTYLSTPLMMTWGVSEYVDEKTGKKSYELSMQFPREQDANYSNETQLFLNSLVEFENKLKADAIVNSKEWLNKPKVSPEVVDALWTSMLKYPKNQETGEYDFEKPPTLRVKIPYYDSKFNVEIYDMNQNTLFPDLEDESVTPLTLIQKTQNIAIVIQNGGIWFANGKFGTTWKLVQGVVQPRASIKGRCFIKLDNNTKHRLIESTEMMEAEETMDEEEDAIQGVIVEDSDEEDASPTQIQAGTLVSEETSGTAPKKVVKKRALKKDSD